VSEEDARHRVRRLLLSGDNTVKNRSEPERYERARERYARAREIAVEADLEPAVLTLIDRRLDDLAAQGVDGARAG
jgi:hypothetical protein